MSATNRADILNKTAKVLKKHYKPVTPLADRSVLEHLLYASCLENSQYPATDDVFAKLQASYFDWNEVRVTTIAELAEVMSALRDPVESAQRVKRVLQAVFEKYYSFDIDILRKGNLGKALKEIEGLNGISPFAIAYAAQNALSGHAIPVNSGAYEIFVALDVISEAEAAKQRIPGLERTIPKSKGVEFASLLHQLTVDYMASPFSNSVRAIILEIDPAAKERLPKRSATKKVEEAPPEPPRKPQAKSDESAALKKTKKSDKTEIEQPAKPPKKAPTKRLAQKKPR